MATVIPRIPQDYHGSPGESEAVLALRHLPQEYYVFHSLRWLGNTQHETQGEADFLIFHPRKGFLAIEVKSGGIRFEDGVWFQRNRNTNIEKPIADPSLIEAAQDWANAQAQNEWVVEDAFSIVDAHDPATKETIKLSGGTQNPTIAKPKTGPYFPFAVFA
jgi:Nuclease-related domain